MIMVDVEIKIIVEKEGYFVIGKVEGIVEIDIDIFLCKGCGICVEMCLRKVFEWSKELSEKGVYYFVFVNVEKCVKCKFCELFCLDFVIVVRW